MNNILLKNLQCITDINIKEYIRLREEVKKTMEHPEWLGDLEENDLNYLKEHGAIIYLYFKGKEFVCSSMLIPATSKTINTFSLNIDYKKTMDYGPIFVNKKYQGNNLSLQMLEELENICKDLGYKYAITTIHPDNIYSINNFIKDKFVIKNTKEFKRGVRNVYLKEI